MVNVPALLHGIVMPLPTEPIDVPQGCERESKACLPVQGLLSSARTRDLFEDCDSGHQGRWSFSDVGEIEPLI